nr:InlB B-repeat-containing protein [Bacillus sp. FJAT-49736]
MALLSPEGFNFGIDLTDLSTFVNNNDEENPYSKVEDIVEKLISSAPSSGFIGPIDLQAALNKCIQDYITENLEITYANGDDASKVTQNLELSSKVDGGAEITWTSNYPQYVSPDGTVHRPAYLEGNKSVTLTATIQRGSQSTTKNFVVTVKSLDPSGYTVSFNTDTGSSVPPVTLKENETITKPENPTKDGYIFDGWYTDAQFTTLFDFNQPIHSDVALYAKWVRQSYTVNFETAGGGIVQSQKVDGAGKVTQPTDPVKEGYNFKGWYKDSNFATAWDFATNQVTSNTTLYAKWEKQSCRVSFIDGSQVTDQNVEYGDKATVPQSTEKEGYIFLGWFVDNNLLVPFDFSQPIKSDVTLVAMWAKQNYTVQFNTLGGNNIPNKMVESGATVQKPQDPTRDGYTFKGWYTDITFLTPYDFDQPVTSSLVLHAKWDKDGYTVRFVSNGGEDVTDEVVKYGEMATEPTNPQREGYNFKGWYKDSDLTTAWDFTADQVTNETTLYAKWEKQTYTVHFDTNGGNPVENESAKYQAKATKPENPIRAGYSFAGWYTDNTFQSEYNFDQEITKDTTLYAKWLSNNATLTSLSLSGNIVLSPAFDPTIEHYTTNVGNNVDHLSVTAIIANDKATKTVNGQVSSEDIHLNEGKNDITIVVTAQDGTTKTYTISVNRAAPTPSTPATPPSNNGSTRQVDVTVGQDGNGAAATVDIVRKVENGVKVDAVDFDESKAQEVVQKAIAQKKDISTIVLTDLPEDKADEMHVNVLQKALSQLGDNHIALQIDTPSASVSLPKETVQSLNEAGNDLYFRVAPIRKEDEQQKAIQQTFSSSVVKQAVGERTKDIQVYGNPITIETNYKNYKTNVLFPLKDISLPSDPAARNAFLNTLHVYVKHTDGTEEFLKGEIVKDSSGNPVSIKIQISKFSTFTVLGVPSKEIVNKAPVVNHVAISGSKTVGYVLKGTYKYADAEHDSQGKTTFKWYRADNRKGHNKKVIKGATHSTYTLTNKDKGKYIGFEVTPVASKGSKYGKAATSAFVGKIVAKKIVVKKQYNGHLDLGVIRSKSYVERVGSVIKTDYHGQVVIKKSGSYYKLSANFKTRKEATWVAKKLKSRKLIIHYSIH